MFTQPGFRVFLEERDTAASKVLNHCCAACLARTEVAVGNIAVVAFSVAML